MKRWGDMRIFLLLQRTMLFFRTLGYFITNWALPLFSCKCKKRLLFERKNLTDAYSRPFNTPAQATFHIASEGELEQIRPLIDWMIDRKEKVEIIYTSESVEEKCRLLAKKNLDLIRIFRLPLLCYFPWPKLLGQNLSCFISAKKLVLCRYDFYPELLLWGHRTDVYFILVSAALKKRKMLCQWPYALYRKFLYGLFDFIVSSNGSEKEKLAQLGIPSRQLMDFDFRKVQILKRVENAQKNLGILPFYPPFRDYLQKFTQGNRLIVGSAWPIEMDILKNPQLTDEVRRGNIHLSVVPHRLDENLIEELEKKISSFSLPCYKIKKDCTREEISLLFLRLEKKPGVLVILVPGILCELYTLFEDALIGGGFEKSVHSLLEPYLAGNRVYCGPKVERSTEYDFIKKNNPHSLFTMKNVDDFFYRWKEASSEHLIEKISKETLRKQFNGVMEKVVLLKKEVEYA